MIIRQHQTQRGARRRIAEREQDRLPAYDRVGHAAHRGRDVLKQASLLLGIEHTELIAGLT